MYLKEANSSVQPTEEAIYDKYNDVQGQRMISDWEVKYAAENSIVKAISHFS